MNTETNESEDLRTRAPLILIGFALVAALGMLPAPKTISASPLEEVVVPSAGVTLPAVWGDIGATLVKTGVIDKDKMVALYKDRGGFPAEYQKLLERGVQGNIVITKENAGYLLNLLWAVGLANQNPILEDTSEMMNPTYKGAGPLAGGFASTGGWTLAKGDAMDHYAKHIIFSLTNEQQTLVDRVSKNIYRPCCGNSTHFPDCNHGMAMLGLLELMASQGVSEQDMYKTALAVNSYWFPDTYLTIATYMQQKNIVWKDVNPQEVLGFTYSSAQGYAKIVSEMTEPVQSQSAGSCST